MKIAISTTGKTLEDKLDVRFGRAQGFLIYDTELNKADYLDNSQNVDAFQGAGIQAGENVVNSGASAVITGFCGPKAFKVLNASDITIYNAQQDTIKNVLEKFNKNELKIQKDCD